MENSTLRTLWVSLIPDFLSFFFFLDILETAFWAFSLLIHFLPSLTVAEVLIVENEL